MSRSSGAQVPPATASGDRLAVIASHLSPANMAGEKEAALAAESVECRRPHHF
ncbi:unnamed protein product [Urochloa humidicola]